jgi:hypothetical protein
MSTPPWLVQREPKSNRASAVAAGGATPRGLAEHVGLAAAEWRHWLSRRVRDDSPPDSHLSAKGYPTEDDALAPGEIVEVPNTVCFVWVGDLGALGRWSVQWRGEIKYLHRLGFATREMIFRPNSSFSSAEHLFAELHTLSDHRELHGLFITGHGYPGGFSTRGGRTFFFYNELVKHLRYRLAFVVINTCNGGWSRTDPGVEIEAGGRDLVADSPSARFYGIKRTLIPQIRPIQFDTCHAWNLLKPGDQGTNV